MKKTFRPGAVGAMMDEYERAAVEFKGLIGRVSNEGYASILDPETRNEECRSIQTIATHVVWSGYAYADYIRGLFSTPPAPPPERQLPLSDAPGAIDRMLDYTVETLEGRWEMSEEEFMSTAIDTRWGQKYDLEQLLEHAIVHVLRHRRQIERLAQAAGMNLRSGG